MRNKIDRIPQIFNLQSSIFISPIKRDLRFATTGLVGFGYTITTSGLGIALKTWARFVERVTRLYEQGAGSSRIGDYVRHWWRWVTAGVSLRVESSLMAACEMRRPPTSATHHHNAYDPKGYSSEGTLVLQVQKKRIARSAPTSPFTPGVEIDLHLPRASAFRKNQMIVLRPRFLSCIDNYLSIYGCPGISLLSAAPM